MTIALPMAEGELNGVGAVVIGPPGVSIVLPIMPALLGVISMTRLLTRGVQNPVAVPVIAPLDSISGPVQLVGQHVLARQSSHEGEEVELMIDGFPAAIQSPVDAARILKRRSSHDAFGATSGRSHVVVSLDTNVMT